MKTSLAITAAAVLVGYLCWHAKVAAWRAQINSLDWSATQLGNSLESLEQEFASVPMDGEETLGNMKKRHQNLEATHQKYEAMTVLLRQKPFGLALNSDEKEHSQMVEQCLRNLDQKLAAVPRQERPGLRRYKRSDLRGLRGGTTGRKESGELIVKTMSEAESSDPLERRTWSLEGGVMHIARDVPAEFLRGTVLLLGFPEVRNVKIENGYFINVIVAPVNETTYTMQFSVESP